jgi:hypothetical protein
MNFSTRKKVNRSIVFLLIILLGITGILYKNKFLQTAQEQYIRTDIEVFVSEEPLNGLNSQALCYQYVISSMERKSVESLKMRVSQSCYHIDFNKLNHDTEVKSWCVKIKGEYFIIVEHQYGNVLKATSIIGISNEMIINITGFSFGSKVPCTCGPCRQKVKEIFGVSLNNKNCSEDNKYKNES